MTQAKTVLGRIKLIERGPVSGYGNPSFWLTIELAEVDGTPVDTRTGADWRSNLVRLRTSTNSGLAYAIENPEYRDTVVLFTLTSAGRIAYAKPSTALTASEATA